MREGISKNTRRVSYDPAAAVIRRGVVHDGEGQHLKHSRLALARAPPGSTLVSCGHRNYVFLELTTSSKSRRTLFAREDWNSRTQERTTVSKTGATTVGRLSFSFGRGFISRMFTVAPHRSWSRPKHLNRRRGHWRQPARPIRRPPFASASAHCRSASLHRCRHRL